MPYPKEWWDAEEQARGKVWREFMRILHPHAEIGIDAVTDVVRFYCEENRNDSEGSFLDNLPHIGRDATDRKQIEEDLDDLRLGIDAWGRHGEDLARTVAEHDKVSLDVGRERARQCWFSRTSGAYDSRCWDDVMAMICRDVNPEARLPRRGQKRLSELHWCAVRLRCNLEFVLGMETLRSVARKTWPADPEQRQPWTYDEFAFVSNYYEEQQPYLASATGQAGDYVRPTEIVSRRAEGPIGFGCEGLSYVLTVIVRAVTIDFAEELLAFNAYQAAKGSFSCQECGQFVSRRFYARGQLYCSVQCKRRAAKRRQRRKSKEEQDRLMWAKRAVD